MHSIGSNRDSGGSTRVVVGTEAEIHEAEVSIFRSLAEVVDGKVRETLLQRVRELVAEFAVTRARVKHLSQENHVLKRRRAEQQDQESRIDDMNLQNQMFETRQAESGTSLKDREANAVQEARQVWERGRMAAEDASEHRNILATYKENVQAMQHRTVLRDDITLAKTLLAPLQARIAELERIQKEGLRAKRDNVGLLQQVNLLRKGNPRWNHSARDAQWR